MLAFQLKIWHTSRFMLRNNTGEIRSVPKKISVHEKQVLEYIGYDNSRMVGAACGVNNGAIDVDENFQMDDSRKRWKER